MVRVCVWLRVVSGGRVDWSSAETAESKRCEGGRGGTNRNADGSFQHLEERSKDEG